MTYSVFAFTRDGGGGDLRRDGLHKVHIAAAVEWALDQGCDTVLVELVDKPWTAPPGVTHHVCNDAACPGGC